MKEMIRGLLSSKKFVTAVAGVVAGLVGKIGLDLDTESIMGILSPLIAYILSQGLADIGKHGGTTHGR
jgi:hypothetical protein